MYCDTDQCALSWVDKMTAIAEGLANWGRPRSLVQRSGFIQTPGGCQGGRKGERRGTSPLESEGK